MMTEIFLGIIIIGLLGERAYKDRLDRIERKNFVNALKAKNATELRDLNMVEKTKIDFGAPKQAEFTPESEVSDDDWRKALKAELDTEDENG